MTNSAEFIFSWRIDNIKFCPDAMSKRLVSPQFFVKEFRNTQWCLEIHEIDKDSEYLSLRCLLRRVKDAGPRKIGIIFSLYAQSAFVIKSKTFTFEKGFSRGSYFPIHMQDIDDYLFIECHMVLTSDNVISPNDSSLSSLPFVNFKLQTTEICHEVSAEIKEQFKEILKRLKSYPKQCFIHSSLLVTRRNFTCPIQDFIRPKSKEKQIVPIINITKSCYIFITIFTISKSDSDYLKIAFELVNKSKSNQFLSCKVRCLDSLRKILKSVKGENMFYHDKENIWVLKQGFEWKDMNPEESYRLQFELAFCEGDLLSRSKWTLSDDYCLNFHKEVTGNNFPKEMLRFYKEKKFCDVTLQTRDRTFDAHKAVLCAMSPVFLAMFESGMEENETNDIHIEDLDSNTVNRMLNFMYTATVAEADLESAADLFVAADKYEIVPLKEECSNILKKSLTVECICLVLSLAFTHKDENLKIYAIDFFCNHKKEVLLSQKWKDLSESNAPLAVEVLQEVCEHLVYWQ